MLHRMFCSLETAKMSQGVVAVVFIVVTTDVTTNSPLAMASRDAFVLLWNVPSSKVTHCFEIKVSVFSRCHVCLSFQKFLN